MSGEQADLSPLEPWWSRIAEKYDRYLDDQEDGQIFSARRFDRAQPAGTRAYINAGRYLQVAHENHMALQAMLEHHGLSPWATYNLVRPSFEAAFFALWILDPDSGTDRRARGLRVEWQDQRELLAYMVEYQSLPDVGREVADRCAERRAKLTPIYQREASALGVSWDVIKQKINVVEELGALSTVRDDVALSACLKGTWRSLSGAQHGYAYPSMVGGEIVHRVAIPGGQEATVTVNDETFVLACTMTAFLFESALNRWAQLGSRP